MAEYGREHVRSYMRSLATYLGATLPIYESMYTYMLRNLLSIIESKLNFLEKPRARTFREAARFSLNLEIDTNDQPC